MKKHANKLLVLTIILMFAWLFYDYNQKQDARNSKTIESKNILSNVKKSVSQDSLTKEKNQESIPEDNEQQDCIFDLKTQTDEFLEGIEELKNYKWDSSNHLATIVLGNNDTLYVSRGGCNHFGVSAELVIKNDKSNYDSLSNVFNKVFWVIELLNKEFHVEDVKEAIETKQYEIEEYNKGITVIWLTSESLSYSNYEITKDERDGLLKISIGYYIN